MKNYILLIFLSVALFQGFLFAEIASDQCSNKSQASISDIYRDEDVLISLNRTYSKTDSYGDVFCIELKVKALADNKIIGCEDRGFLWNILDNFGNNLYGGQIVSSHKGGQLRPKEEILFTIEFTTKPLENTKYLLCKIPKGAFGNLNPFELKIVKPVFETVTIPPPPAFGQNDQVVGHARTIEELDRMAESERWVKEREHERLREENKRLLIASVVSLLVAICIIWLFISKRKIIPLFIKTLFGIFYRPKVVLWTGILLIVVMCFFPPWVEGGKFAGYANLFSTVIVQSGRGRYADIYAHIDSIRLIIQCTIVGIVTGGWLYTLKDKETEAYEK